MEIPHTILDQKNGNVMNADAVDFCDQPLWMCALGFYNNESQLNNL